MLQPAPAFVRTLAVRTPVQHPVTTTFGTAGVMHLLEPSYSNANNCDFGAIASFSPLPLDVHTLRMCRFPTLRTRSGSNTRTVAALAKLRSITGFKKSKIEPEVHYLLCHCLARCLPSYCCTGAYWRILENTAPYWCMCSAAAGSTTRLPDSLEHPEPELTLPGCNC